MEAGRSRDVDQDTHAIFHYELRRARDMCAEQTMPSTHAETLTHGDALTHGLRPDDGTFELR